MVAGVMAGVEGLDTAGLSTGVVGVRVGVVVGTVVIGVVTSISLVEIDITLLSLFAFCSAPVI